MFDLDQITYAAAAAAEMHWVKVTHKDTGKIVPYTHEIQVPIKNDEGETTGYETKRVKGKYLTKTDFYGRGNEIGGHLGKINAMLEEKGKKPFTREDFEIEDIYETLSMSKAIKNAESKIKAICEHLGVEDWIGIIDSTDHSNFRLNLPMPEKYKSVRDGKHRPALLPELKEYFRGKSNVKVVSGMESDDFITIYGFRAWRSYHEKKQIYYIPVSFDKDNLGTPYGGVIVYNHMKVDNEFKYSAPFLCEGLGSIWMKDKSTSMADGFMQICRQMLLGDWQTDGFMPRSPNRAIRYGEKACFKELSPCQTAKEAVEVVNKRYKKWFPDGVEFTDYTGKQQKMTTEEWQEIIFQCLYMKHDPDDPTTWGMLVKKFS